MRVKSVVVMCSSSRVIDFLPPESDRDSVPLETRSISQSRSKKANFAALACLRELCLALTPPTSNACSRSSTVPARVLLETRGGLQSRSDKTNFAALACLRELCLAFAPMLCIQCMLELQHRTCPRCSRNARRFAASIKQDEFRRTRSPSLFQCSSRSDREPRN